MPNTPVYEHLIHHRPERGWHMDRHGHPDWHELILVLKGGETVWFDDEMVTAAAGDLLVFRAGVAHEEAEDAQRGLESFCLSFRADLPVDLPIKLHDHEHRARVLLELLSADRDHQTPVSPTYRTGLLQALLAELERLWRYRRDGLVAEVRRFVRERIHEPLCLDDLAAAAGMSKYHFVRRYRDAAGITPMRDVTRLRVEYARDLILSTALPLKAIAGQAGFGDVYQLSRAFRRHLGTPPGALRRGVDT